MSKTLNLRVIGTGILAGLATAVLSAGAASGSGLAMLLFMASPLPLLAAGLGWGTAAAIVAAAVSTLASGMMSTPLAALAMALTTSIPAAVTAYLCGLARPADEVGGRSGQLVWYPLADVMFRLALMVSAGFIILGIVAGYGPHIGAELARQMIGALGAADPQFAPSAEFEAQLAAFLTRALPAMQPAMWMLVLAANLYLALAVVRMSRRLARPRDDWPAALRMPRPALLAFAVGLVLSFAPDGIGHAGTVVAGSLGGGFLIAGLAMFHLRTRGRAWRTPMLWLAYLAILLFAFVVFFFVIAGMFDTSRPAPVSDGPNGPGS